MKHFISSWVDGPRCGLHRVWGSIWRALGIHLGDKDSEKLDFGVGAGWVPSAPQIKTGGCRVCAKVQAPLNIPWTPRESPLPGLDGRPRANLGTKMAEDVV